MQASVRLLAPLFLLILAVLAAGDAYSAEPKGWLTGAALEKQLQQSVGLSWSGLPLRQAVERLAASQRIAVLLDRRVDPGQAVELSLKNVPIHEAFARIAAAKGLGMSQLGPVIYFGPPEVAARLRTLAALRKQDLTALPQPARNAFLRSRAWRWEDLAEPRKLLADIAAEAGVEIEGLDAIPHDLWAAADLPAVTLVDRLTLLLAQFDLTFEIAAGGKTIRLVPAPDRPVLERAYTTSQQSAQLASQVRRNFPDAEINASGGKLVVHARIEDHELIAAALRGERPTRSKIIQGEHRYTVAFHAKIGDILKKLETTGLAFEVDEEALRQAGIGLDAIVMVNAKEATLDELLEQVLKPAGLTFRRQEQAVQIMPAKLP